MEAEMMGLGGGSRDGEMWSDSGYKYIDPKRSSDGLDVECEGGGDKAMCVSSLLLCNKLGQIYRTVM